MLSIGKLGPGRADYYLDTVARGAEYYLGSGEAPGRWVGRGAGRLGLAGEVAGSHLRHVLNGAGPDGRSLVGRQGPERMPGFDCTFDAPKSVTLLFALGSDEVRREVRDAHDAAVDAALAVLEGEACRVRRGRGGAQVLPGDGFVAAAFRHRTSRSGDPQLHTHVEVANLAHARSDDRWSALDGRHLYSWCRTVGFLYEAHLRAELSRRLGVTWQRPRNGIADVAGIPRRAIEHFSQRRRQIVDRMAEIGSLGGHAAQIATWATRQAKDTSVPYAGRRGERTSGPSGLARRSLGFATRSRRASGRSTGPTATASSTATKTSTRRRLSAGCSPRSTPIPSASSGVEDGDRPVTARRGAASPRRPSDLDFGSEGGRAPSPRPLRGPRRPWVWDNLGLGQPADARPHYVGKAERNLASRDVDTHFSTGKTGSSTLRRSLAGLLTDELRLEGRPRNPAKPERFANFGLEASGDERLTGWMVTHLRLAVWPSPDGAILDEVETAVLEQLLPPLNVAKVWTPWRTTVQAGRRRLAEQAEAWATGLGGPT